MSVLNLSINIIRFLISTYNPQNETYIYKDLGNYIRKIFSKLHEKSDIKEIFELIYSFDEKNLLEFYNLIKLTNDFEHFSKEFKAKLFIYTCEELNISKNELKIFLREFI